MVEIKEIDGILNKIVSSTQGDSFTMDCIYSDGGEHRIYMISFYNTSRHCTFGKIAFEQSSGHVNRCVYRKHIFNDADNIIDLLLDVYNYQQIC